MRDRQYSCTPPFNARLDHQLNERQTGMSLILGRLALVAAFTVVIGLIVTALLGVAFWLLDMSESLVHYLRRTR